MALLIIGGLWLTNLIWFKPFSINHFYEKSFVELVLDSPELTTQLGIPIIYDWYKDDLDDISDAKQWENFNKTKEDFPFTSKALPGTVKINMHNFGFLLRMRSGIPIIRNRA